MKRRLVRKTVSITTGSETPATISGIVTSWAVPEKTSAAMPSAWPVVRPALTSAMPVTRAQDAVPGSRGATANIPSRTATRRALERVQPEGHRSGDRGIGCPRPPRRSRGPGPEFGCQRRASVSAGGGFDRIRESRPNAPAGTPAASGPGRYRVLPCLEKFMSMSDRDGLIWFNGRMVDWRDARIHVLTHSLHYGMGIFEGVRAYKTDAGTAIFRLDAHTR